MNDQNTHIGEFLPGRGYRVFVSAADLVAFRAYIVRADPRERERYGLSSPEEPAANGAVYHLGLQRSRAEMDRFLSDWTLRID